MCPLYGIFRKKKNTKPYLGNKKKKRSDDLEDIKVHVAKQAVKCLGILVIFKNKLSRYNRIINNRNRMKICEGCPKSM